MKRAIAALFVLAVVLAATSGWSQEKAEVITVQSVEVHITYFIATVQTAHGPYELRCYADVRDCNALQPGNYVMVWLSANSGPYVYPNIEVYPTPADPESLGKKLGVYCLISK